jgi:UV excision repair protein RAD23
MYDVPLYDFAGKILNDAQPLSDYKIQENSFVVVMVSRVKAKPPEVGTK